MRFARLALLALLVTLPLVADEPRIELETEVAASVEDVWNAWTTVDGVKSFFAGGANIEPHPDGMYEIFFDPSQPAGHRGADGMRILIFEPNQRLAFTWNAPAKFPHARAQRTHVTISLKPIDATHTRVRLVHDGFGDSEEWKAVHEYFTKAWGEIVLPRLKARFEPKPEAK